MIHVLLGTKAQLIKMAPVMRRMAERGVPYRYISTGQHRETVDDIHANFGIRPPDVLLHAGADIVAIPQMLRWAADILAKARRGSDLLFAGDQRGIVLVHGDTFSTLLGAVLGRYAGLDIGHVESGLRSFKLHEPFPEELLRLAVFRLSHLSFCPGDWACGNLRRYKTIRIDTGANTLADALAYARPAMEVVSPGLVPKHPFGIVTLHRFENIRSRSSLARTLGAVEQVAEHHRLLFILHPPTAMRLRRFGLYDVLERHPQIELRPRHDYLDFMRLLNKAALVVSDGGSNQEECAYLGKPVLLLRNATERCEGLGDNVVLSRFDRATIAAFAAAPQHFAKACAAPTRRPSDIVIDACLDYC